jgi:hypothetical protein
MRTCRLFAGVAALSFVVACETKAPPEDQAAAREGLTSRIKAQARDGVDGGAVSEKGIQALNSQ